MNLNLSCFIRGDMVMNPGQIDFGIVRRSEKMPRPRSTLTYAGGRSDWEVTKMKTLSNKIKAELRELSRTADGQINYCLTATLQPGVPNGYFQGRDHALDQRPDEPDHTDLGGGQHPECGVGHAVDHQFRRRSPGANRLQDRDRPLVSTVLDHEAFRQRGSSQPVDDDPKARPVHQVKLTFKAPEQNGPHHAVGHHRDGRQGRAAGPAQDVRHDRSLKDKRLPADRCRERS